MKLFFQNGQKLGLNITYSHESKPLGPAGPLALVDGLEDTFLVSNGDVLTTMDMRKLIEFHKAQNAAATISTHTRKVSIDLGVVVPGNDHNITGYIEKPTYDYLVSMGIYVFEPRVLSYIPKDEYLDFPDLVKHLLDAGEKVSSYQFNGYWQDLGRPDDYERASLDFEEMRSQFLLEE
jgi:NDP-sugar pyrophosphorylase family protein